MPVGLLIGAALAALYVALIAVLALRGRRLRREVKASRTWRETASRVVESRLDERHSVRSGTAYEPVVVYEYQAGGRTYRGARPYFGETVVHNVRSRAELRRLALARAAAARVFVDPLDASRAVIERSAPVLRRDAVLTGVLLAVLAIGVAFGIPFLSGLR